MRGRSVVCFVLFLFAATLVSGCGGGWRQIIDEDQSASLTRELRRIAAEWHEFPGVPLAAVTKFSWDRLFTFGANATGREIRARSGQEVIPDGEIFASEGSLLVFADGGRLSMVIELAAGQGVQLAFDNADEYSADARLTHTGKADLLAIQEPTPFQRLVDADRSESMEREFTTLARKGAVPLRRLTDFPWDGMHLISGSAGRGALQKELGIPLTQNDVDAVQHDVLMVFSLAGRPARVLKATSIEFPEKVVRRAQRKKWSDKVQVRRETAFSEIVLRDP